MTSIHFDNVYKLDKIFTEEYFYNTLSKPPVIKVSNLQNILFQYKQQIKNHEIFAKSLHFKTEQIYTSEFFFDDNQYYKISWNIDRAQALISESNMPIVQFELNRLSTSMFDKIINPSHLRIAKHNKHPIIIAFYEPTHKFIAIDGNHRAYTRLKENLKTIDAYLLSPKIHTLAMCSPLDYTLYKFAHNLNVLGSYICGEIAYKKFMEQLYRF